MSKATLTNRRGDPIGQSPTYRASDTFVAAIGVFPFLVIAPNTARIVARIKRIRIWDPTLTAAQIIRVSIQKLSALPTGGTSTQPAKVPMDSLSPASKVDVKMYTVVPTAGTVVGKIGGLSINGLAPAATALSNADEKVSEANELIISEPTTLRGIAEGVALIWEAGLAPASAVTLRFEIEWTEDGN